MRSAEGPPVAGGRREEIVRVTAPDGLRLRCRERGPADGLSVVLVHAFPLGGAMWRPQLDSLSDEFRLLAYDVRGFGGSEAGDGQHTMELFVDDLLAVLDARVAGRPVVCGLSMGGYIALRALEREPERFQAAVLCDTKSVADDDAGRLGRAAAIARIKREGLDSWARDFVRTAFAPRTLEESPELVAEALDLILSNPPVGVCGALLAMAGRTDTTRALERLRLPVLVLAGEHDALIPPAVARDMAERIPGAEARILPDAGHLANLENAGAFDSELRAFLRRVGARTGKAARAAGARREA